MNSLENQVAIVTGGAMGIGGATSRSLADSGAKVLIADIAIESAETNARAIRERGGTVLVVEADVSKALSIKNMIDHAIEEWGRLDILVNNAAIVMLAMLEETTNEMWDRQMECMLGIGDNMTGLILLVEWISTEVMVLPMQRISRWIRPLWIQGTSDATRSCGTKRPIEVFRGTGGRPWRRQTASILCHSMANVAR